MRRSRWKARNLLPALLALALAAPGMAAVTVTRPDLQITGAGTRGPIRLRLTAPVTGKRLPIIVFSHGASYSGDDYLKLADYWAAHGFIVIQPTHLDARILNTAADDPRQPRIWRLRRDDIVAVIDNLAAIEAQAGLPRQRADNRRIVVVGHSYGGFTTELLLGATTVDTATGARDDLSDPRVAGGILLSAPGGFDGLTPEWQRRGSYLQVDWSMMKKPVLVVFGETDFAPMTAKPADWHADAYHRAPPGKACLIALPGVGHFLGGIGKDGPAAANDAPNPAAVERVEQATLAWTQHLVDPKSTAWQRQLKAPPETGKLECR